MGITGRSSLFSLSGWVLILVIVFFGKTCNGKDECKPSSCGNIHNISYPFRLKHDPKHCGRSEYFTLSCENNITVLEHTLEDTTSGKYYVLAINYDQYTLRVVDPGLHSNNCSSVPRDSSNSYIYGIGSPYFLKGPNVTKIRFFKCPNRVNSSWFVDTAPCINSQPKTYGYVTVDYLVNARDLEEGCSLEWITWESSLLYNQYYNNASYKYIDIHNAMVHGFQVSYYAHDDSCGSSWIINYNCFPHTISGFFRLLRYFTRNIFRRLWDLFLGYFDSDHIDVKIDVGSRLHLNFNDERWATLAGIGLIFSIRFLFGTPIVMALLIHKWRRRHFSVHSSIEDFLHGDNNIMPIRYSYSNIKKMTTKFKDKLGEGGYGSVFKGKLRSGRFGAIKMLGKPKANGQDFISEVATIGRIHHFNVVQLIGYCVEGSKRALVYDFMPNGSLDKYIYTKEGSTPLSCKQIYEISLGVAQGIKYLHQGCDMQILHFDIKPHNILLDENFTPKISDFGLAKLYPTDNSIVSLTAARGTMGYMAPELFYKNIGGVSFKADVYSFGMLLMEMASKRKNLNALVEHSSQIYFPSWVYDQYDEGNDLEIGDVTEEERKIVKKMVITALWCIQLKPSDRPSMNKVIEMLEGNVERLEMPPKPYLCPQEIPVYDAQDNLNPACSNVELTCTLSAR